MAYFDYYNRFKEFEKVRSVLRYGDETICKTSEITVLMPVFSHPDLFRIALKSVINQDYKGNYTILVVDNNPYDLKEETQNLAVVKEFSANNILYYQNESNIGLFGNWNRCLELCNSPYLTFCHDDDMFLPGALSRLMSIRDGNKAIFSAYNKMDSEGQITYYNKFPKRVWPFEKKDKYSLSMYDLFMSGVGFGVGCLFSKKAMIELGGFNADYYPCSDYIMFTRYTERYGALFNNVTVFNYRIAQNVSVSIYEQFAPGEKKFCEAIIPKLQLPSVLLKVVLVCKEKYSSFLNYKTFGVNNCKDYRKPPLFSKLVYCIFRLPCKLKQYHLISLLKHKD